MSWRHKTVSKTKFVIKLICYLDLAPQRHSLSMDAAKTLASAFISSRLDYCNSLLAGATSGLLTKLQSVQNAAARFATMSRKFDHITPILCDQHWLPVRQRITFKVATLVYKCLHGFAPPYFAEDCVQVASRLTVWSAALAVCSCSFRRPRRITGHGLSLFMNPTRGTAFQLNCD